MAFPYVDYTWVPGNVITAARLNNLESQFQSVLDRLTTRGDTIYRGATTWERRAKGTEGQFLRQGANDPAWVSAGLTVAETQVFNSTSPTAWTDLSLSGVVGSNATLVLLKVGGAAVGSVAVRKDGDTDEFYNATASATGGVAIGEPSAIIYTVLLVATSNTGVIEWKCEVAQANTTVDTIAYIPGEV